MFVITSGFHPVRPQDSIVDLFALFQTTCQDAADEEDADGDDEQAEYDGMLIENAGEIIPTMARIVGGQVFTPYLAGYLPELLKRVVSGFCGL